MPVIIDGTAGITSPGGDTATVSVATPIVKSPSSLTFQTNGSTTAVTINTAQQVGIGTANPAAPLTVVGDANANFLAGYANSGDTYAQIGFYNNIGTVQNGQIGVQKIGTNGGMMYFKSKSDGGSINQTLTLNGSGNLGLFSANTSAGGVGLTFPSTQYPSSDANCLDDYEEGSWTPVWNGGTITTINQCQYVKVGKQVTITGDVTLGAPTGSASFQLSGMPFVGTTANQSVGASMWNNVNIGTNVGLTAYYYGGVSYIGFYKSAQYSTWATLNNNDLPSSSRIIFTMSYFIG